MTSCHGCYSYGRLCAGNKSSYNIQCPCIACLVKVVCGESCEEYRAFSNYINKRDGIFSHQRVNHMKVGVHDN